MAVIGKTAVVTEVIADETVMTIDPIGVIAGMIVPIDATAAKTALIDGIVEKTDQTVEIVVMIAPLKTIVIAILEIPAETDTGTPIGHAITRVTDTVPAETIGIVIGIATRPGAIRVITLIATVMGIIRGTADTTRTIAAV